MFVFKELLKIALNISPMKIAVNNVLVYIFYRMVSVLSIRVLLNARSTPKPFQISVNFAIRIQKGFKC